MPYFAQLSKNGTFWVAILEKAWAKIWGNYANIGYTKVLNHFYLNFIIFYKKNILIHFFLNN